MRPDHHVRLGLDMIEFIEFCDGRYLCAA